MTEQHSGNLWEKLWIYDPNGLVVVNSELRVAFVNPAFCRMFAREETQMIGLPLQEILGEDPKDFRHVLRTQQELIGAEKLYRNGSLYVRKVLFPIPENDLIACIMVDLTKEWLNRQELAKIRRETIEEINKVVNKEMQVAQEIAGLLGETTAETRIGMLKLKSLLERDIH